MESAWRSWPVNLVAAFGMSALTNVAASAAFSDLPVGWRLFWGALALANLAGFVRSLASGVFATNYGIVMRNPVYTTIIAWHEVEEITTDVATYTAAGAVRAVYSVVIQRRPGKPCTRIQLEMLGASRVTGKRPGLNERAVAGLSAHLAAWRADLAQLDQRG